MPIGVREQALAVFRTLPEHLKYEIIEELHRLAHEEITLFFAQSPQARAELPETNGRSCPAKAIPE